MQLQYENTLQVSIVKICFKNNVLAQNVIFWGIVSINYVILSGLCLTIGFVSSSIKSLLH